MFLLNCDTCDRGYHMQCLQPPAEDKPKSAWRCSFCLDHHETTIISIEEPLLERKGKKSSLKNQRYCNIICIYYYLIIQIKYIYQLSALDQYATYKILVLIYNKDVLIFKYICIYSF